MESCVSSWGSIGSTFRSPVPCETFSPSFSPSDVALSLRERKAHASEDVTEFPHGETAAFLPRSERATKGLHRKESNPMNVRVLTAVAWDLLLVLANARRGRGDPALHVHSRRRPRGEADT